MLSGREKAVLQELRKNSRQSFATMARKLGTSKTTIFETDKKVRKFVTQLTSLLNFSKAGFPIRVIVHTSDKNVHDHPSINNLQKTTDGFWIEAVFPNAFEKFKFLDELTVKDKKIEYYEVVSDIKREFFIP